MKSIDARTHRKKRSECKGSNEPAEELEVVAARATRGHVYDAATLQLLREELWEAVRRKRKKIGEILGRTLQVRRQLLAEQKAGLHPPPESGAQGQKAVDAEMDRLLEEK